MHALFIGGTGIISASCVRAALAAGIRVTVMCRGETRRHPVPAGAPVLRADVRDVAAVRAALADRRFDAVVQWVGFLPAHVQLDVEAFRGKTGQYVFISSASAYRTPGIPITESTPLRNPAWQYSRDKIDCEAYLTAAYRSSGFPVTIVRPSHTYDDGLLPVHGGWTVIDRMRRGLPVVVHGDGSSLWTLTHCDDFARGLVGLLGHPAAVGEAFHITSDEVLTWDQIHRILGQAAGVEPELVHVPSDLIAAHDAEWGASLLGDKAHSKVFDNSKVRRLVPDFRATIPYARGAERQMAWYEADPSRRVVDDRTNATMDRVLAHFKRAWPEAP